MGYFCAFLRINSRILAVFYFPKKIFIKPRFPYFKKTKVKSNFRIKSSFILFGMIMMIRI